MIRQLAAHPDRQFADGATWQRHLEALGIAGLPVMPDPGCIATEGAWWGSIQAHGFLHNAVGVSEPALGPAKPDPWDAGQFDIGEPALCWVHAERLVHQLETFTDLHRIAQEHVRGLIGWYYADLKAYRAEPAPRRRSELRARFDRIFHRRPGCITLDRLLQRLPANQPELLRVLDRPGIPLHTNGSENDIRCQVTKRQVSGGTKSDNGRDCRDAFLGLGKTGRKLGIVFWDYLGARLGIPASPDVPYLPQLVRCRAPPA